MHFYTNKHTMYKWLLTYRERRGEMNKILMSKKTYILYFTIEILDDKHNTDYFQTLNNFDVVSEWALLGATVYLHSHGCSFAWTTKASQWLYLIPWSEIH